MSRRSYYLYNERGEEFLHTMEKIREICEEWTANQLFTNRQTVGVIFCLKNNYSWKDEVEQKVTTKTFTVKFDE